MPIENLQRGQSRTYSYPGGTIPIRCESLSILTIAGAAQFTRWTVVDIPGAADTLMPPTVQAVMDDIAALRVVAREEPSDALVRRDAIAADLERHLNKVWHELHRHVLFGTHMAPPVAPEPDVDPCGFGGADVAVLRSAPKLRQPLRAWLAMVVVPPQIARCTLLRPLLACD
jgi:hypothetical protein